MPDTFNLYDIYEQNLNFLIGSGASFGYLPTLSLKVKDEKGVPATFETLAKYLEDQGESDLRVLLFMYYYKRCIKPGLPRYSVPPGEAIAPPPKNVCEVLDEYKRFVKTLVTVLGKQERTARKANIYTSNYDSCFEVVTDNLLAEQSINCVVNDGSAGFKSRSFHTKNFNTRVIQRGIFDKHDEYLPQLNILHLHGSVFWRKSSDKINIDYGATPFEITFSQKQNELLDLFEEIVEDDSSSYEDLLDVKKNPNWDKLHGPDFMETYKEIPIVNPTKWKFHETLFEEAYYQILRHLSFELERPNSVLIVFGFSFADEHILHLVQRSLSNPSLTVYVSCFDKREEAVMRENFKSYSNVKYIALDENLTFRRFNKNVFTLNLKKES